MPSRTKGELGEALAAQYLEAQGWRVAARNYRCPWGEIDLICENEQFLIFVEVKARTSVRMVCRAKQSRPKSRSGSGLPRRSG